MRIKLFLVKLFNWEFWPFEIVYFPLFLYWIWLSIKAKSFFFFSASNPSIETGGMFGESKISILRKIPENFLPITLFVKAGTSFEIILKEMSARGISYPVIAKPDVGERGKGVEKINEEAALLLYCQSAKVDFLIQEFVNFEVELGVFYYRHPDWEKGIVSSVVKKDFLKVKGDGHSTILELINRYPRAAFQAKRLCRDRKEYLSYVPSKDEEIVLEPIGNHSRGTTFLDANFLIDQQLVETMDRISKEIKDFYYGRYDLKCKSIEDLKKGKEIKILELNGAGAEPGHIYQPGFSLVGGYKVLFSHWTNLYEISRKNRKIGHRYMTFMEGWKKVKWIREYNKLLNS